MSVTAQVQAGVRARVQATSGLTQVIENNTLEFTVSVGDCDEVYTDRRQIGAAGFDEVDFSAVGIDVVKLLFIRNLSSSHQIAMSAGRAGSQFSVFRQDATSWNFSPMINLGSLTLRGYPIRENGSLLLSCPNSDGFGTTAGGSILRIGGTSGQEYEIYVMGT
jgi:hypothetical protein